MDRFHNFRKFHLIKNIFLLLTIFICASVGAEEKKFDLTSFIPERFIDFRWQIDGGGGYDRHYDPGYSEDDGIVREKDDNRKYRKFEVSNNLEYINENLSRYYIIKFGVFQSIKKISDNTVNTKKN